MPRSANETRRRILGAAYLQFSRRGFGRVGVDEIAAAAKVTKRTLYYHFKSKDELLAAVLESQHHIALQAYRSWGDRLDGNAERMVDVFFAELAKWLASPRWSGSGFTRLAMELADLPGHPARVVARHHKAMVEAYLAERFGNAGMRSPRERAREIALLAEGAMALTLVHGDRAYARAAARAAKRLLQKN